MGQFASNTSVSVEKSRNEIERTLQRYGANGFAYSWQENEGLRQELIEFLNEGRRIRFVMPMPSRDEFKTTPTGIWRSSEAAIDKAWEQACRQRWRALNLAVKAKLEAVECGISEFEKEFLAQIVNPATGQTVYEELHEQLKVGCGIGEKKQFLIGN